MGQLKTNGPVPKLTPPPPTLNFLKKKAHGSRPLTWPGALRPLPPPTLLQGPARWESFEPGIARPRPEFARYPSTRPRPSSPAVNRLAATSPGASRPPEDPCHCAVARSVMLPGPLTAIAFVISNPFPPPHPPRGTHHASPSIIVAGGREINAHKLASTAVRSGGGTFHGVLSCSS